MSEFAVSIFSSPFFGITLTLGTFFAGVKIQAKLKSPLANPLLIAIILSIGVLLLFDIPYEYYDEGGSVINLFLAPATACLAVSIYSRLEILKQYWFPILLGCAVGSAVSMGSIYGMCRLFRLAEALTYSLVPKSVTTPIAISISSAHGGLAPVTIVAVIITGILGSIFAPALIKLFRIQEPVAAGLGIGACSHAVGTSKALEIGEVEGAMSGLAIGVCGVSTVLFSLLL